MIACAVPASAKCVRSSGRADPDVSAMPCYHNHPLRLAALAAGERVFMLDDACAQGHMPSKRYVKTGQCVLCASEIYRARRTNAGFRPKEEARARITKARRKGTAASEVNRRRNVAACRIRRRELLADGHKLRRAVIGLTTHMQGDPALERSRALDATLAAKTEARLQELRAMKAE